MAGITCKICSKWEQVDGKWVKTEVKHPTVAAVKVCNMRANRAKAESK